MKKYRTLRFIVGLNYIFAEMTRKTKKLTTPSNNQPPPTEAGFLMAKI